MPLSKAALKRRQQFIGASDSAAVLGLSPYQSPVDIWALKTGMVEPEDLTANAAVQRGIDLETTVGRMFKAETGLKLLRGLTEVHPTLPYVGANLDYAIEGSGIPVECKTTQSFGDEWGEPGTDEIPQHYITQVQHQMAVTDSPTAYLAALSIREWSLRVYKIDRDVELINDFMLPAYAEFWCCVQERRMPTIDPSSPTALKTLKRLYPGTTGEIVQLSHLAAEAALKMENFKAIVKEANAGADVSKALIMAEMGEASIGVLPDGTGFTRKRVERKGYEVQPTSYIDFRFTAKLPEGLLTDGNH